MGGIKGDMLLKVCCLALAGAAANPAPAAQPGTGRGLLGGKFLSTRERPCSGRKECNVTLELSCDLSLGPAEDCGWPGISAADCHAQGCCFGHPRSKGPPKCYATTKRRRLAEPVGEIPPACVMPDASRVDCGFHGITPAECVQKGCCYFHAQPGHPFCYFKAGQAPSKAIEAAQACEALDEERIDCGYDGVTDVKCVARGCCYRHPLTPGAPFCYYKRNQAPSGAVKGAASQQCIMSDASRVDCGFDGMTPQQCRAKGCCYFHSHTRFSPYCYYMANQSASAAKAPAGEDTAATEPRCAVPGESRKDCGFEGISAPQCRDSGCCYGKSSVMGSPFCYYKSSADSGSGGGGNLPLPPPPPVPAPGAPVTAPPGAPPGAPVIPSPPAPSAPITPAPTPVTQPPISPIGSTTRAPSSDVMAGNHFNGEGTKSQDMADSSRSTLLTVLAAAAIALVLLTGCCLRSQPASEPNPEEALMSKENLPLTAEPLVPPSPRKKVMRLEPGSQPYMEYEDQFRRKWDTTMWPTAGRAVPCPAIKEIYEIETDPIASRIESYRAKYSQIDSYGGANENVEFHGARLTCDFKGNPCNDVKCKVCRIIESGSFGVDSLADGGIHFRSGSHAAKGQGLAPGKQPPPANLEHFVSSGAGNAVFLANVLLGTPQIVSQRTQGLPPEGMHSRIADKAYGVDEIVVFDEAQALPKALVLLR